MPAQLISGREIAATIREELQTRAADLRESTGRVPGLATVLVGEDPASQLYVVGKVLPPAKEPARARLRVDASNT